MPRRTGTLADDRRLSLLQIASLCCGLFGVQIVWGLQNVNTSRIFQTLGADIAELPMLWIAGPIAGLLVQPFVGHWSDRTWGRFGRRRPFLMVGAAITAIALLVMPNTTTVLSASLMLWLLTIGINIVMEPFRALLADLLPEEQRDTGFALQVLFIGSGAVFASALPWIFAEWLGWSNESQPGRLPASLHGAFYAGALGLLLTVGWSVIAAKERPRVPQISLLETRGEESTTENAARLHVRGYAWLIVSAGIAVLAFWFDLAREGYVLVGVVAAFGATHLLAAHPANRARSGMHAIAADIIGMPEVMRKLAAAQFATWFGLFAMWVYLVPAVASRHYDAVAPGSPGYNEAANHVGVLFAAYNGVAAVFALFLPRIVRRFGRREAHAACLALGACGLAGFRVIDDPGLLWLPIAAIGCAWASILSVPYAMVASAVPPERVGVFMGIHNIFLVLPQLAAAATLGPIVATAMNGNVGGALDLAAGAFVLGAVLTLRITRIADPLHAQASH